MRCVLESASQYFQACQAHVNASEANEKVQEQAYDVQEKTHQEFKQACARTGFVLIKV